MRSDTQKFLDGYFDTDHLYPTTREEIIRYAPKIDLDGIIARHDYSMGNWNALCRYGVVQSCTRVLRENNWELLYLTVEPDEYQSFAIRRIWRDVRTD